MAHSVHFAGCHAASSHSCSCEIKRYTYVLLITLLIALIQFVGSVLSGSLALFADTMHVLLDGATAGISVYVAYQARTHHDPDRLRIFWMRVSGVLLLGALVWIAFEAILRFWHPQPVEGPLVMGVAFVGMVLNFWQHELVPHDHSATGQAQLQHIRGDLGSSAAVLASGMIIWLYGWQWIDPLLSLGVSLFIGYGTVKMLLSPNADTSHGHTH